MQARHVDAGDDKCAATDLVISLFLHGDAGKHIRIIDSYLYQVTAHPELLHSGFPPLSELFIILGDAFEHPPIWLELVVSEIPHFAEEFLHHSGVKNIVRLFYPPLRAIRKQELLIDGHGLGRLGIARLGIARLGIDEPERQWAPVIYDVISIFMKNTNHVGDLKIN